MSLLVIATALCYAAALGGYAGFLATSNKNLGRAASVLVAGGLLLHYLALLERSRWEHNVPYNDLYGSLSLFAWLLAATYLGLEMFHRRAVGGGAGDAGGADCFWVVGGADAYDSGGCACDKGRCWRCTSR